MRDGLPTTEPIQTKQQAIDAINDLFLMNGYKDGKGDFWLGHTLDRLKEFLDDPHPFARHETNGDDRDYCQCCAAEITINNKSDEPGYCFGCVEIGTQPEELRCHRCEQPIIGHGYTDEHGDTYHVGACVESIADAIKRADSHIKQITPNVIEIGE